MTHSNYENKFSFVKGASCGAIYGLGIGAAVSVMFDLIARRPVNMNDMASTAGLCALINGVISGSIEVGRASAENNVIRRPCAPRSFTERVDAEAPLSPGRLS